MATQNGVRERAGLATSATMARYLGGAWLGVGKSLGGAWVPPRNLPGSRHTPAGCMPRTGILPASPARPCHRATHDAHASDKCPRSSEFPPRTRAIGDAASTRTASPPAGARSASDEPDGSPPIAAHERPARLVHSSPTAALIQSDRSLPIASHLLADSTLHLARTARSCQFVLFWIVFSELSWVQTLSCSQQS